MRRSHVLAAVVTLLAAATFYFSRSTKPPRPPAVAVESHSEASEDSSADSQGISAVETGNALPPAPSSTVARVPDAPTDNQGALTEADFQKLRTLNRFSRDGVQRIGKAIEPLRRWAQSDPASAAQWVNGNLYGDGRARALEEVFGIWGQSSPRDALAWLAAAGSAEGFRSAYAVALSGFAYTEPTGAADWLRQAGNRAPSDGWSILFSAWGQQDPDGAASWATANLTEDIRARLLPELLQYLRTPSATSQLISNTSPAIANDALAQAARLVAQSDPQFALRLASQITGATRSEVQADIMNGRTTNAPNRDPANAAPTAVVSEPPVTGSLPPDAAKSNSSAQ